METWIRGEVLKGHLDLILLTALERGPAYGYSIISEIERDTEGHISISDGTIYPALHRLERSGLLSSTYHVTSGRRRRVYTLTDHGREESSRLQSEWDIFSRAIQRIVDTSRATKRLRRRRGA